MQYGAELRAYQRTKKEEKSKKTADYSVYIKIACFFITALLVSRVILVNKMAPFGLAFLVSTLIQQDEKLTTVAGFGALLGYVTIHNNINNLGLYALMTGSIVVECYVLNRIAKRKKTVIIFSTIYIEVLIYNFVINNYSPGVNFLTACFEAACIFPLYFIMSYAITCVNEIKSKHLFSNEEIISMAILLSLIISGTWGISLYSISLRNVLAFILVIGIAYINGSTTGAAAGVAMGAINGMTSSNIITYIGVYGLCGLTVGLFKETGKWLSGIAYIVAFAILKLYSNLDQEFKLIEALISCGVFLVIPKKVYNKLSVEFDLEKKAEDMNLDYVDKMKDIFIGKLNGFSDVLLNMSNIVNNLVNNDKLLMKNKSSALIENLADRVCSNCNMNSMCWKRELHYTYTAFAELIENYQQSRKVMPQELERKCVKRTSLITNTEDIVNNFIISEMWRNRLTEGRQILAGQINNMAVSVRELVDEFSTEIQFKNDLERNIKKLLNKNQIKYSDLFCFQDKKGRISVRLSLDSCGGSQLCVKQILPYINAVTGKCMCVGDEGCQIDPNTNECSITFEETPKYHVATYVGRECKSGEKYNGDSYSFGKLKDGTYMVVISDGMGSGPEAGKESQAAVELIERFTEAGFTKNTAINTVNSIMALKFSEDEKFSTLDLASIDLYSGEIDFMKVGAVASFIKRGEKVETIKSKTLPIGILDKVEIDISNRKLKNGDIVVMLSDGLLDSNVDTKWQEQWIIDYLENSNGSNPKDMVDELLEAAKEMGKGKLKDDITVVVSKIYNLY